MLVAPVGHRIFQCIRMIESEKIYDFYDFF